ncbi:MAG: family 10 glycosylhydrolase, partial [Victivallales bacterium]|nr:family 10 glycosylhydrolase [Victivallales bacterium]
KTISWTRSSQGRFQGMKATGDALPMQSDIAYQGSPHSRVVEPTGDGKIIAKWVEPDGTDSGLAAATVTPTGVFLGHVWFDGSGRNMRQFLLSIVNYLAPDIWRKSASNWLENIGVIENYTGLEDIRARFPKDAPAEATVALNAAFELREKGRKALNDNQLLECITLCENAQDKVIEALCRQAKPVEGEQRGFWCHSAFGLPGNNWDESIKFLADNGFNTILPNMLWGGMAYYKSDVLPTYANYAKQGDQVRQCLDACKKYGVKCHVWKVNWNMGSHLDKAFVEKMKAEKRTQVLFNGEQKDTWLCPSNPLNRRQEADAMLELVRNYPDLDGIHFDYIRYPDGNSCFCDGCRARFEERIGRKVENWPANTRSAELKNEWLQFRRDNITALVKLVHDEAKAIRPTIQISAALFGNWMSDRDGVGQDWELWCRNGWLDFACPMDYVDSAVAFKGKVKRQIAWAHNVKLCPGIGLSCWTKPQDPLNMIEQIQAVRDLGLKGYTVFNFDNYARAVLPSLRLGCTSK